MASPIKDTAWLDWIARLVGTASRQTYTATLPTGTFHCVLDELPLHLVPQDFLASRRMQKILQQPLVFNPDCWVLPDGQWPAELAGREDITAGFARQGAIAWVCDTNTRTLLPFWLGPKLEAAVRGLPPNEPVSSELSDHERTVLAAAGIFTPRDQVSPWPVVHHELVSRTAATFQRQGYVPLRSLIHPFHVAALRRYYRHQLRLGAYRLGDRDNPLRYVAKNDSVARFFHHQLTSMVSAMVGQPVKPSYVYFASYRSGAELVKHTDRPQCEFSITLCLDFSPEPAMETSWPIRLDTPGGTVAVYQALGDGLVYRGPSVPHYRTPLPEGRTSTSIFFHYVAQDFDGPLD